MTTLHIDFISDVACPWCAIGLHSLEEALRRTAGTVDAKITFQPFELNPDMPSGGQNHDEHLRRKFGMTAEQLAASREQVRARAASVGLEFNVSGRSRIYNTFDAHRLLHWAEGPKQVALKLALFRTYFTENRDVGDHELLAGLAGEVGLDAGDAAAMLAEGRFTEEVRRDELLWRQRGINAVPAAVVEGRYLISGGQPADAYEGALRQIAGEQQAVGAGA